MISLLECFNSSWQTNSIVYSNQCELINQTQTKLVSFFSFYFACILGSSALFFQQDHTKICHLIFTFFFLKAKSFETNINSEEKIRQIVILIIMMMMMMIIIIIMMMSNGFCWYLCFFLNNKANKAFHYLFTFECASNLIV